MLRSHCQQMQAAVNCQYVGGCELATKMHKHLCQHRRAGFPHLERKALRDVYEADDAVAPTFIAIGTLPALDVAMG